MQELLGVVPLVQRLGGVEPFVALQTNEVGPEHARHDLGDFRLAHPRVSLDEERLLEGHGQVDGGGNGGVRDVVGRLHHLVDLFDLGSHGPLSLPRILGCAQALVVLGRVDVPGHGGADVDDGQP